MSPTILKFNTGDLHKCSLIKTHHSSLFSYQPGRWTIIEERLDRDWKCCLHSFSNRNLHQNTGWGFNAVRLNYDALIATSQHTTQYTHQTECMCVWVRERERVCHIQYYAAYSNVWKDIHFSNVEEMEGFSPKLQSDDKCLWPHRRVIASRGPRGLWCSEQQRQANRWIGCMPLTTRIKETASNIEEKSFCLLMARAPLA